MVRSSSGLVGPSPFEGARRRLPGQADLGSLHQDAQGLAAEPLVQARLGVSNTTCAGREPAVQAELLLSCFEATSYAHWVHAGKAGGEHHLCKERLLCKLRRC